MMVSTASVAAESHTALAQAAQCWWSAASPLCSTFFEISTEFNHQPHEQGQVRLLNEMADIYKGIENISHPKEIDALRSDLLESMTELLNSFARELKRDKDDAFRSLDRGLVHILRFCVALEKLDLHF